ALELRPQLLQLGFGAASGVGGIPQRLLQRRHQPIGIASGLLGLLGPLLPQRRHRLSLLARPSLGRQLLPQPLQLLLLQRRLPLRLAPDFACPAPLRLQQGLLPRLLLRLPRGHGLLQPLILAAQRAQLGPEPIKLFLRRRQLLLGAAAAGHLVGLLPHDVAVAAATTGFQLGAIVGRFFLQAPADLLQLPLHPGQFPGLLALQGRFSADRVHFPFLFLRPFNYNRRTASRPLGALRRHARPQTRCARLGTARTSGTPAAGRPG